VGDLEGEGFLLLPGEGAIGWREARKRRGKKRDFFYSTPSSRKENKYPYEIIKKGGKGGRHSLLYG